MDKLKDSIVPLVVGNTDGNGVVVGDLFITAGHVANKGNSISMKIGKDFYCIDKNTVVACLEESTNAEGLFNDYAIYKLNTSYNDLCIDRSIPAIGSILKSYSYKHIIKHNATAASDLFANTPIESHEFHISKATVVDVVGNFIVCEMEEPLEEGRSGSPLFFNDKVVGILHGGIEGKVCVFQLIHSIPKDELTGL